MQRLLEKIWKTACQTNTAPRYQCLRAIHVSEFVADIIVPLGIHIVSSVGNLDKVCIAPRPPPHNMLPLVGKKILMRMVLLPVKAHHGSENTLEGTGMEIKDQNISLENFQLYLSWIAAKKISDTGFIHFNALFVECKGGDHEFCKRDFDVETVICTAFGGDQSFYWSFINEENPQWKRSGVFSSYRKSWKGRHRSENEYGKSTEEESDCSYSDSVSHRLALGLSDSGPLC
ncbi:unnamed protein product [Sphenostylis stenocarpa]|uniref:Uncharacterized protein n=1 Tax=Sphenostylis stenocarpa TaxID=92480 RepID=A0AA86SN42_9FABA|nr:unnamed protein product [Sphenostylis stenocarpa]